MPPTDRHPDHSSLLEAIERRAGRIWLRRRLAAASAVIAAVAIVAVPVTALSGGNGEQVHVVDVAGDPPVASETTSTTDATTPIEPEEPLATPTTTPPTTTSQPSCTGTADIAGASREDGGLRVEFGASGMHLTVGCAASITATGSADPGEVVVFDVDWGDGTIEDDPQPSIVCDGPSDDRAPIDREFRHTFREPGRYEALVSAMAYVCTDDGVVTDRVTFETTFTVNAA